MTQIFRIWDDGSLQLNEIGEEDVYWTLESKFDNVKEICVLYPSKILRYMVVRSGMRLKEEGESVFKVKESSKKGLVMVSCLTQMKREK